MNPGARAVAGFTLAAAVDAAAARLAATSPTPQLDAEVLVGHVLGLARTELIARADHALAAVEHRTLDTLIARRAAGEPIAYLTGIREFWSLEFAVTTATLIPRPETELLVERAIARLPPNVGTTVADLGTGCGAIACALAHERPDLRVIATDQSEAALMTARANATRLGLGRIEFRLGDWCRPLADGECDLIVSNPPYLRADDPHLANGDLRFEPRAALVAGPDGFAALHTIVTHARRRLRPGGWLLLEHGYDQAEAVEKLAYNAGFRDSGRYTDLAGHDRVLECH